MDLKKEIKLSALFKRKREAKPSAETPQAAPAPAEKRARTRFLERGPSLSFRRRAKATTPDDGPVTPTGAAKRRRRRGGRAADAHAVPAIPLMRAFDLLPKDDAQGTASRRANPAQLALAVVGLVLVAVIASLFLVANARVADKEQEVAALVEELAAKDVARDEPAAPAGDAALVEERDGRTGALATALGGRVAWDRLLRDVSLVLPEDVWLNGLTGSSGAAAPPPEAGAPADPAAETGSSVELAGYAHRHEAVAQFLSRLQVLPELELASLVTAAQAEIGKRKVIQFTIKAVVKPQAAGGGA